MMAPLITSKDQQSAFVLLICNNKTKEKENKEKKAERGKKDKKNAPSRA
jgi:hypothetical protein